MNENLDLTKILEGCPVGTEFYSSVYGKVQFICIDLDSVYAIQFSLSGFYTNESVTKKGTHNINYAGECVLFPSKDQRDWSKFERFWDKPKVERFDPKTLQPFDKILVRDTNNETWSCGLFSHIENLDDEYPLYTVGTCNKVCIPYNDETKHLLGTKEDCSEYYKWWEEE